MTDAFGEPLGMLDTDRIRADATILAFELASSSDCAAELDEITAQALARVGSAGFGYVAAVALRMVIEQVLEPVLQVTDRCREVGVLAHDVRDGLAQAAENARATLGGGR